MRRQISETATANGLRREISARNVLRSGRFAHELTFGDVPGVIYSEAEEGSHGNFLDASYRRICADEAWKSRLNKTYTSSSRVPRHWERRRGELECASSSDALLMNVFCYPRLLHRSQVCSFLGIEPGLRPAFGVRAFIPMQRDEIDRTELDMCLGPLIIEAKLTESGFGSATRERLMRYISLEEVFDVDALPWNGNRVCGYQLIRGVLAAFAENKRFVLLCDSRRADLLEVWFRVLRAVRRCDVRSSMALLHWQELAAALPLNVQRFLEEKYGVVALR